MFKSGVQHKFSLAAATVAALAFMSQVASAQSPQPLPAPGDPAPVRPKGLLAQYYNDTQGLGSNCPAPPGSVVTPTSTTATLAGTQREGPIDSAVVAPGRPAGVNDDNIYARFSGFITTTVAGDYTITIRIDDGGRLWFNQNPLTTTRDIDSWIGQAPTNYSKVFTGLAAATRYPVTFEWFEGAVTQYAGLLWTPPGGASAAIPLAQLTPPDGPPPPTLTVTSPIQPGPAQVNLSWNQPAGATGYIISRATTAPAGSVQPMQVLAVINSGATLTYTDNAVAYDTTYDYIIQATSQSGCVIGLESATHTVTPILPAVMATPLTGLQTNESGTTTTFQIIFNQPAPVGGSTLTVLSNNTAEGTVQIVGLGTTAIPGNPGGFSYVVPAGQKPTFTVTVTGVNDNLVDGPINYTISVTATGFSGPQSPPVNCTNNDDDTQGLTFSRTAGLLTTEGGGQDSFTVVLNKQPFGNVSFNLASSNTLEGTVAPTTLTFTNGSVLGDPNAWNVAHQVTLTGVDDTVLDFTVAYQIVPGAISFADARDQAAFAAAGITGAPTVSAINLDNEVPPALPTVWGSGCGLMGAEFALPLLFAMVLRRRRTSKN